MGEGAAPVAGMRIRRKRPPAPPPPTADGPPLEVDVSATGYGAIVTIAGELDLATAPRVRDALASEVVERAEAVVVDLTGVTFMDSSGLAALLTFERDMGMRRRRLTIACPEGAARLLLDVTGVAEQLALYPSRADAEAAAAG